VVELWVELFGVVADGELVALLPVVSLEDCDGVVADGAELLGVVAVELLWSVELGVLLIEPVALLFELVPVVLVLPTWLWL